MRTRQPKLNLLWTGCWQFAHNPKWNWSTPLLRLAIAASPATDGDKFCQMKAATGCATIDPTLRTMLVKHALPCPFGVVPIRESVLATGSVFNHFSPSTASVSMSAKSAIMLTPFQLFTEYKRCEPAQPNRHDWWHLRQRNLRNWGPHLLLGLLRLHPQQQLAIGIWASWLHNIIRGT